MERKSSSLEEEKVIEGEGGNDYIVGSEEESKPDVALIKRYGRFSGKFY